VLLIVVALILCLPLGRDGRLLSGDAVEGYNIANGAVREYSTTQGAIASSRTFDPSVGEFEDAPSEGSMSQMGQTRKYSLRVDVFRFGPESGLKTVITGGPFRANNGSRAYSIISSQRASIFLRWSFGQPGLPQSFFQSREVFGPPKRGEHVFEIGNT